MKIEFVLFAAAAFAAVYFLFLRGGDVSGSEARRMVEGGALLLDVRTKGEFDSGHLPGAVNIPVQELDARLKELPPADRPVVVYCRSGQRSGRAARMLKEAGYASVLDLGSINRW